MIEYFIYTVDEAPVDIAAIVDSLRESGWSTYIVRDRYDHARQRVVSDGQLQSGDWIIAHRLDDVLAAEVRQVLGAKDLSSIAQWIDDGTVSFATWEIREFHFDSHSEFESMDDARLQMGDDYANFLSRAKRKFIVEHGVDPEFGAAALGAVAMLANGIVEDPQLGKVFSAPANQSEVARYIDRWPGDMPCGADTPGAVPEVVSVTKSQLAQSWWEWVDERQQPGKFNLGRTGRLLVVIFGGYAIVTLPIALIWFGVHWVNRSKQERQHREKLDREWSELKRAVDEGEAGEAFTRLFGAQARQPVAGDEVQKTLDEP
jgi:hypothetical protein